MNEKFNNLPLEKRLKIINSGFKVFAENSYKKSPMSEVAEEAEISKSLLFYYFRNKKELYLYLLKVCSEVTVKSLKNNNCYDESDIFEIMKSGLYAKFELMKNYPNLGKFAIKAYYETDSSIVEEVQYHIKKYSEYKQHKSLFKIKPELFKSGIDLEMMYKTMYWSGQGYVWEMLQNGQVDIEKLKQDFEKMIEFWKKSYLKNEVDYDNN